MIYTWIALASALGLFIAMLVLADVGRRIGVARVAQDPNGLPKGIAAAEGAVFGFLGLLIAFTFAGAAARFDGRLELVAQEANAIGTAYLRIDLLPDDSQAEMRALFRRYTELRSAIFSGTRDITVVNARLHEAESLQGTIWTKAILAGKRPEAAPQAIMLMLPALNAMFDITTTRKAATMHHPPLVVFLLLGGLSLIGAMLIGYGMSANKSRSWLHTMTFALTMSLAIYVIVDIEFPRLGLIRVDFADKILVDLRDSMG